jgi:hypothetical protein
VKQRLIRRLTATALFGILASWLVPVAAHAGFADNHNETLVRAR